MAARPNNNNNGEKVTLAVIAAKLDNISIQQNNHYERFEKHCADDILFQREVWIALTGKENTPGLATRVDRMEQNELRRQKHWWVIYPLIAAGMLAQLLSWLGLRSN